VIGVWFTAFTMLSKKLPLVHQLHPLPGRFAELLRNRDGTLKYLRTVSNGATVYIFRDQGINRRQLDLVVPLMIENGVSACSSS
jgi:hypothetical protein